MRPDRFSLRTTLLLSSLLLLLLCAVATELYLSPRLDAFLTRRIQDDLTRAALLISDRVAAGVRAAGDSTALSGAAWDSLADEAARLAGVRVTLIATDGRVAGDSDVETSAIGALENHAARPEVREALERQIGSATRFSETVRTKMAYVAVAWGTPVAGVVRVAAPLTEVERFAGQAKRLLLAGLLSGFAVAGLVASLAAPWISRPVENLARIARGIERAQPSAGMGGPRETDGVREASGAREAGGARESDGARGEVRSVARALDALVEDRTRVSEALRRERDLLSAVLEGMRDGVLVLDAERRIVMENAALHEFFLAGPETIGKTTLEAFRSPILESAIDEAVHGRREGAAEIELAGLKPRTLAVLAISIRPEPGGPLLAVFHDVTDLRRLETVRRDFVASASHELRTPVAAIRGAAEALEEAGLGASDEARAFAGIVRRHSEQLSRLVEDLLDLSRIEAGGLSLVTEPLDLAGPLESAAADFEEAGRARRIRIAVDAPAALPLALADRNALRQILRNLVDNACKYANEGGTVTLGARADGSVATVTVEDDGPGIEERHLPRLFERFYRIDVSRSRALGGTGLGLAIVKHLVETMGGRVLITSAVGRGTAIRFTLPLAG